MKRNYLLAVLIAMFVVAACAPSKEPTGVWVDREKFEGKTYKKLFIVVLTADIEVRVRLETDLANLAISRGYQAVKCVDVITADLKDPKPPAKDDVIAKVKETGCDVLFAASLLRKDEAIYYTPSKTGYTVLPYYSYVGSYSGYYSYITPTVYTPGYYSHEKEFFMHSNLYDVASETLVISVQSTVFNPADLDKFSKSYTSSLMKQLEKEKLLKK